MAKWSTFRADAAQTANSDDFQLLRWGMLTWIASKPQVVTSRHREMALILRSWRDFRDGNTLATDRTQRFSVFRATLAQQSFVATILQFLCRAVAAGNVNRHRSFGHRQPGLRRSTVGAVIGCPKVFRLATGVRRTVWSMAPLEFKICTPNNSERFRGPATLRRMKFSLPTLALLLAGLILADPKIEDRGLSAWRPSPSGVAPGKCDPFKDDDFRA